MPDPTPPIDLDEIEIRAAKATPGPWRLGTYNVWAGIRIIAQTDTAPRGSRLIFTYDEDDANADFIAHAREGVPALVAEVRRLREALEKLAAMSPTRHGGDMWGDYDCEGCQELIDAALAAVRRPE